MYSTGILNVKWHFRSDLQTASLVIYPNPGNPYILDTDASKSELEPVLSKVVEGQEHVINYFS